MTDQKWINGVFSTIDSMDAAAFAALISPDGTFQWGAYPVMTGTEAITQFVAGFFSVLSGLSHNITDMWKAEGDTDVLFINGEITYTVPNGAKVNMNFLNVFRMEGKLIREYKVYADPTALNEALSKG